MPLVVMEDRSGSGLDTRAQDRLAAMEDSVRRALQEVDPSSSSVYSRSPNVQQSPAQTIQEENKTPKARQLFGLIQRSGSTPVLRHISNFHLPFAARGGSVTYSPATQPTEWARSPVPPSPTAQPTFRHPADTAPIIDSEPDLEGGLPPRPRKHKRKHRKQGAWTRKRKTQSGSRTCAALFQGENRLQAISTAASGVFLASVLTIYLTIAITIKNLNQQVHVLFILTILAALVFFTYSLIRLVTAAVRRKKPRRHRPIIPSVAGPEGFKPDVPIRVQLARDEEIAACDEDGKIPPERADVLRQPPPAYGLWRGSVRLDPNLLHWQRADAQPQEASLSRSSPVSERRPSPTGSPAMASVAEEQQVRRPPSYASDDGVSYVVSALPPAPPSEIHPAFRIRLP
ncbi:uncharacterized protein PV09_00766 [Verruconis gallopava]|uniref:Uncharacterized protein n=1 Tax=Verruconis gallopava TaxID=253628 RepID=A0A0D1Z799_9PEZI|nr:uncharacterized protein PV09_00766 [Verruconis gallopava]KIW08837.1 hypothetical protein PV09_00766 [Verruconis gallopava]